MPNRAGYGQVPCETTPRMIFPKPAVPFFFLAVASCLLAGVTTAPAQGEPTSPAPANPEAGARRVVLMVWDGLRPDSISDETTPTLAKLAREGVFFDRHHPVYPSMTEVNGTALTTGCYPAHSGVTGNREFRPAIDPLKTVAMESLATIRRGDEVSGGHYLLVPTLPELLHAAGWPTIIAGTKSVVTLMDRAARREDEITHEKSTSGSMVLFEGQTLPAELGKILTEDIGHPFPIEVHFPNVDEDAWTTAALTGPLWKWWQDGPPKFSVLWMSDPDYTQHRYGPDSPQAHRALASADADLATVLKTLETQGLRDSTDVLVVSDHGFSTIGRPIDVAKTLSDAGFNAGREYKAPPQPGDILVNGLGGTVFLYVAGHDAATIRRLTAFLQGSDFAGVVFTRDALPGTFALSAVHIDSPDAPDIAVALRWNADENATGFPGEMFSDGSRKAGQGNHATLSHFDMHNTLVAAGPDFKKGWRDEMPSGNVDLAPTIAYLLGLRNAPKMDGRVLSEALATSNHEDGVPPVTERAVAELDTDQARWHQYLQVTHFGGVDYFDEGNGAAKAKVAP